MRLLALSTVSWRRHADLLVGLLRLSAFEPSA